MQPYISLIIPAYNEEERIIPSLKKAEAYFESKDYSFEIIVVDDGSSDNTCKAALEFDGIKVVRQSPNQGKGAAVRRGMLEAEGEYRLFADADFSTPIYEVEKLIIAVEKGADVAIGSRALNNNLIKEHQPFYREFMGKTFNKLTQALVIKGIKDTQCGFKLFREKAALDIFKHAKVNHFGFDVEILFLAHKFGYKIAEIPVEWYNDERSKVNPIKDSYKMLRELFKIKKMHRRI
jgi:dolichyl-phosphate beta-glucosyltransferase